MNTNLSLRFYAVNSDPERCSAGVEYGVVNCVLVVAVIFQQLGDHEHPTSKTPSFSSQKINFGTITDMQDKYCGNCYDIYLIQSQYTKVAAFGLSRVYGGAKPRQKEWVWGLQVPTDQCGKRWARLGVLVKDSWTCKSQKYVMIGLQLNKHPSAPPSVEMKSYNYHKQNHAK